MELNTKSRITPLYRPALSSQFGSYLCTSFQRSKKGFIKKHFWTEKLSWLTLLCGTCHCQYPGTGQWSQHRMETNVTAAHWFHLRAHVCKVIPGALSLGLIGSSLYLQRPAMPITKQLNTFHLGRGAPIRDNQENRNHEALNSLARLELWQIFHGLWHHYKVAVEGEVFPKNLFPKLNKCPVSRARMRQSGGDKGHCVKCKCVILNFTFEGW